MKIIIYIVFSLIIYSCVNSDSQVNNDALIGKNDTLNTIRNNGLVLDTVKILDDYFKDPIVQSYESGSDTLVISENCVIFLWPDSLEIEEMKAKYPDDYATILDDMIFYASEAAIALDESKIKNFFCDKSVLLLKDDKKDIVLKRKNVEGNMILFKYGEKPVISYAINFDIAFCTKFFAQQVVTDTIVM